MFVVSGFKAAFAAAMACRLCANAEACANALDAGDAAAAALGSAAGKSAPTYRGSRLVCARAAPPSPAPPAPGGEALPGEFAPLPARLEKRVPPAEEAARSCAAALSPVMPNFSSENVGRAPSGCGACGVTSSRWGLTNAEAPSLCPPAAEDADAPAVVVRGVRVGELFDS